MKLEIIDIDKISKKGFYSEVSAITISKQSLFRFTKPAFLKLNLIDNKRIDFIQDKIHTHEFYIRVSSSGKIKVNSRNPKEYSFTSARLKKIINHHYDNKGTLVFEIKDAITTELGTIYPLIKIDCDNIINYKIEE